MEELKYQILEKINFINYYCDKQIEGIRRQRYFQIGFGLIVMIIGFFSYYDQIQLISKKPRFFDEGLILMAASLVIASIWVITRKRGDFPVKDLNSLSKLELKKYLIELTEEEEKILDRGARDLAHSWTIFLTIVIPVLLILFSSFLKTGKFELPKKIFTDEGIVLASGLFMTFFGFTIAEIFGSRMSPR